MVDLAKVMRPANDKYFDFHPANLRSIFSHRWLNVSLVTRLVRVGIPRYIAKSDVASMHRVEQMAAWLDASTFFEKYILDF